MMAVALTAIFSFALGVLLSAMAVSLFLSHVRGKRAGAAFVGGILRGMAVQGIPRLSVWTPPFGLVTIATMDLAVAVEDQMFCQPPDDDAGGSIDEAA